MTERIIINKSEDKVEIMIKSYKEVLKQKIVLSWIILFSLCGIAILTQFFLDYSRSYQLFFGVYLAFWFYFEFKVIYAYRWRKYGFEKIIINSEEIILMKGIGSRVVFNFFKNSAIRELSFYESKDPAFIKAINDSYWNINKYSLVFKYNDKLIPFAIDLDKNQVKKILNEISSFIKTGQVNFLGIRQN